LTAKLHHLPLYEFTPLQVKQAVSAYGKADKQQVQRMVKMLLNLEKIPKPDDAADALAVAICVSSTSALHNGK
jgi:crossover junction endodeoxyribonuclease RuvC